jgi:hypothetical protein
MHQDIIIEFELAKSNFFLGMSTVNFVNMIHANNMSIWNFNKQVEGEDFFP